MTYISNNPGFRLKHPGVPDGSDGSDGTSYPLTENYTLPVALHSTAPGSASDKPVSIWEHLESQQSIVGKTTSSLVTLLVRLELIATTNRATISKTHVFRLYSHLCIYVSI